MNRHAKFQVNFPDNLRSLNLSEIKQTLTELPVRIRDFISLKLNSKRFNDDDTYDDMTNTYGVYGGNGSVSGSSTISRSSGNLSEAVIYNSGTESVYNGSILSESASVAPPPPPPPPPPHQANKKKHKKRVPRTVREVVEEEEEEENADMDEFNYNNNHASQVEEMYQYEYETQYKSQEKLHRSNKSSNENLTNGKSARQQKYHKQF
jgi:hypothetical protein